MEPSLMYTHSTKMPSLLTKFSNQHSLSFSTSHLNPRSHQTHLNLQAVCARNKKRRNLSVRSITKLLESAYFVASNLKILPEPLDLLIREFGGGNGGRIGFLKGLGGGGGGFDGRSRRNKRKWNVGFMGFFIVCGLALWMILGKEMDSDVLLVTLVVGLFFLSIDSWKRELKDWILGFCFCAGLVGLGFKRALNLQKWARNYRALDIVGRRRR